MNDYFSVYTYPTRENRGILNFHMQGVLRLDSHQKQLFVDLVLGKIFTFESCTSFQNLRF
jgi:hypothetical protein